MKLYESFAGYEEFTSRYPDKNTCFAFFSASKYVTQSEDTSANKFFRKKMKDFGFDVIRFYGTYKETKQFGETAVIFFNQERLDELIALLFYYGKYYDQNGFIVVEPDRYINEYSTRSDSTYGGYGKRTRKKKFVNNREELEALVVHFMERTFSLDRFKILFEHKSQSIKSFSNLYQSI